MAVEWHKQRVCDESRRRLATVALRDKADGRAQFKGPCHRRECQHISGGHPNATMAMPEAGFTYTNGSPKQLRRGDLPDPVTREFCADCGTHILAKTPNVPGALMLKVGTLEQWKSIRGT